MNTRGLLVYKCKRCGDLIKDVSVPKGAIILSDLINNVKTGETSSLNKISFHICSDNSLGVTELIGLEYVKEDK